MRIVILGLSITSSWGNGHATIFRALAKALHRHGHDVMFLERDVPWYAPHRDLSCPPYAATFLYPDLDSLMRLRRQAVRDADLVLIGSYVPEGVAVGQWVVESARGAVAFYDIDTPVTLGRLARGDCEYVSEELIRTYDLYLSFTGGPTLRRLETQHGAACARPLYCCVDPELYRSMVTPCRWDLGYMGTYSDDRQPRVNSLLIEPARQRPQKSFTVAGPQYPDTVAWPGNVERIEHLPPTGHCTFYNAQRLTLNVTRAEMIEMGYAPSVRLFEAGACGCAIVSDPWEGLDTFFEPGHEILIAADTETMLEHLDRIGSVELRRIGDAARKRVLAHHTASHRARELERYAHDCLGARASS